MKKHVTVILAAVALSCAACTATNPSNSASGTTPGATTASPSVSVEVPAPTPSKATSEAPNMSSPTATATFHQVGNDQPLALLTGPITIEGRCVYVTNEQGPRTLVRFSDRGNPSVDGDTLSFDGHTYRTGDQADFGGGDGSGSSPDGIPAECDTSAIFDAYPFPR